MKPKRKHNITINDAGWANITSHLPTTLAPGAGRRLRDALGESCGLYLTALSALKLEEATARALRSTGKGHLALFEKLEKGLRSAADAWKKITSDDLLTKSGVIQSHDDLLTDFGAFQKWECDLEAMATEAKRRLAELRQLAEAKPSGSPFPDFVRQVASNLRAVGLKPTVTGEAYADVKPTWFQELIEALKENILGDNQRKSYSKEASASEVAKIMSRSYAKSRKRDKSLLK